MKRGLRHFRLAVLILCLFHPLAAEARTLPETFVVRALALEGVAHVPKKGLSKTLAARPRPAWRFWEKEEPLSMSDLEDDEDRIRQFYRARGYYHVRVALQVQATGGEADNIAGDRKGPLPVVRVTFKVTEGAPVIVAGVRIDIAGKAPGKPALLEKIPLRQGRVFTESDYRSAKKAIERYYGNRGFAFAKIDGRVRIDVRENRARATFTVDPGRVYRFGEIEISQEGPRVKEEVVRRALAFAPGEPYTTEAVDRSRRNLVELDVFRTALIAPGQPAPEADTIPVKIRLQTKKPRQVGFGVGYGSEDGLRLRASWTYRNAFSRAGRFTLSARRTDLLQNVQGQYTQPYWPDARTDLRSLGGWEREIYDSYTNRRRFLNAAFDRRLHSAWTGSIGYGLEINDLEKVQVADPAERREFIRNNQYLISAVDAGIAWKKVDNELYPTDGGTFSLASQQAFGAIGSELSYVNPSVEARLYRTYFAPVTFAGRLKLESIEQIGDTDFIPVFKRLFLGGSNTVRGYGYRMLGPLDAGGAPLGGKTAANGNLEARFPIYGDFSGVVFFDAGAVDPDAFRIDAGKVRTSCGAGFRYDSVIGPLRVEVGYKLNPTGEDELPAGVAPEKRWRLHFSVGQTF